MTAAPTLTYLFDPLCGWCYGAAPALETLAASAGARLELGPVGLFLGSGRRMTPEWGAFIWGHDQRIARMTGQTFSAAYHERVIGHDGGAFDSELATRALTWLASHGEAEAQWLHRIQRARFVDGQDICDAAVLGAIVAVSGHASAAEVADQLRSDHALARATHTRVAYGQSLMHDAGIHGVPALLVDTADGRRTVDGNLLYGDPARLLREIDRAH